MTEWPLHTTDAMVTLQQPAAVWLSHNEVLSSSARLYADPWEKNVASS